MKEYGILFALFFLWLKPSAQSSSTYQFIGNGSWDDTSNWVQNRIAPKNIPEKATVIIDHIKGGTCIVTTAINIQQYGDLVINQGKELEIRNGNLSNSGMIVGPGKVVLTGKETNGLNSPGTITAPLVLITKTMDLAGNSNTNSIELLKQSFIQLNQNSLMMGGNQLIADDENFIVTNGTGSLYRTVDKLPVIFPIGTGALRANYSPATLTNSKELDYFSARVEKGVVVMKRGQSLDLFNSNVNLTWHIGGGYDGGTNISMQLQWDASNEQAGFNRDFCYISQEKNCEPPPNCDDGYYFDRIQGSPAQGLNPFYTIRDNIFDFIWPVFIITSQTDTRTFTGNIDSDWANPANWTVGIVPESTVDGVTIVRRGMELIIDPVGGVCDFTGEIRVEEGGILTVAPGKVLNIHH